ESATAPVGSVPVATEVTESSFPGVVESKLKTCMSGEPPEFTTNKYLPVESSDIALGADPVENGEPLSGVSVPSVPNVYPVMTLAVRFATYTYVLLGSTTMDCGPNCEVNGEPVTSCGDPPAPIVSTRIPDPASPTNR